KSSIELDKKTNSLTIITENDMRLKAIIDSIISRMMKQHLDPNSLDLEKQHHSISGNMIRKDISVKEGIDKETSKKIVKKIKDSGFKGRASSMGGQVRVHGKEIDDMQSVIQPSRSDNFGQPLQFINM